ncbi:helix-turn-helix domain-containing protein [Streptomyces spectabilis]|uniref:DNA-binding NarL/FixJ family response regulator n=1 Tax=Streptomyces spectabilis TaxID=68270 RepID=A0A7W8B187_STRST|nr:helix-turn-helix domain-containing protein [Streptomyces spectabilis]MBB5108376.1 DNA-binding NarL/FixJ family response regulator [Streptomyces spectabilis]MCI3901132.1 helix-turn-helix domain-containing protein [Streptomyces spectabilis]GGV46166.1 hypothetical protein GCM10010245_72390 [Streptomyces spectabilis]
MTSEADHTPSRACYLRGCRETACEQANYRYMARLRLDHHRGQRRRHDATQTRNHVERLYAHGWTQAQISRAARLAHTTIRGLEDGQATVSPATARAVLNIPITQAPDDLRDVDATGTVRRIRALAAIGYSLASLAPHLKLHVSAVGRISRGEYEHVRATTAHTTTRIYRELSRTPGTNQRARNHARKHGWHGPLAWDDNIDNPDAKPETAHGRQRPGQAPPDIDPRRVARLTSEGLTTAQIAERIGCHPRTVTRARKRAQQQAVAA